MSWSTEHKQALAPIQDRSRSAVNIAFLNNEKVICVYTNANEALWAAKVTQTNREHLEEPTEQQQHEPLAFVRSKLDGLQRSWTIYNKKGYAVVETFERLNYLFRKLSQTRVFTVHSNILYLFASIALRSDSPRHFLSKVH